MNTIDDLSSQFSQLVRKRNGPKSSQFGKTSKVKSFFRDRRNEESGTLAFTEHGPVLLPDARREKYDSFAIQKLTDRKNGIVFDRYPTIHTTHIRIQSPILCRELEPILKPYNVNFDDDYAEIAAPFEPLFFARHEIFKRSRDFEVGTEERKHFDLLLTEVMREDMGAMIKEIEDLEAENKITWSLLWALFSPKSVVVSTALEGHEQAYRVLRTEYAYDDSTPIFFDLRCAYVRFNGLQYGMLEKDQTIPYFTGKKSIMELDVCPLRLASESTYLQQKLLARGKKMLEYQDVCHVQIKPTVIDSTRPNYDELLKDLGRGDVHGRAIVDFYTGAKRNDKWNKPVKPLYDDDQEINALAALPTWKGKGRSDDSGPTSKLLSTTVDGSIERPNQTVQEANKTMVMLDDTNLVLMCPLLHAFSLRTRRWIDVNVESVSAVEFSKDVFNHLVADQRPKDILYRLVESQKIASQIAEDPIPEKGRGLLVLLSGPPGTGKTLMTEAIAEKSNSPLYYVDARDLGSNISEIGRNFKIIMENASEWNAIVLLDECDIYLQQRSTVGFEGNDRVTAFLHHLEYFQGILFLTTNLYETLDKAVESRIHVHIPFKELSRSYRAQIWANFLARIEPPRLSREEIVELSCWDINGRQIKNVFRMSLALCRQEGSSVHFQVLEDMVGLTCPQARKQDVDLQTPLDFTIPAPIELPPRAEPRVSGQGSGCSSAGSPHPGATQGSGLSLPQTAPGPSNVRITPNLAPRVSNIMPPLVISPNEDNSAPVDDGNAALEQSQPLQAPRRVPPAKAPKPARLSLSP